MGSVRSATDVWRCVLWTNDGSTNKFEQKCKTGPLTPTFSQSCSFQIPKEGTVTFGTGSFGKNNHFQLLCVTWFHFSEIWSVEGKIPFRNFFMQEKKVRQRGDVIPTDDEWNIEQMLRGY